MRCPCGRPSRCTGPRCNPTIRPSPRSPATSPEASHSPRSASGIGFAIATIGRNTAIALGVGFGYIVILENILGSSLERWRQWLVLGNVIVLVSGNDEGGGDIPGRTVVEAAVFLTVVTIAMLAVAAGTFRARDLA